MLFFGFRASGWISISYQNEVQTQFKIQSISNILYARPILIPTNHCKAKGNINVISCKQFFPRLAPVTCSPAHTCHASGVPFHTNAFQTDAFPSEMYPVHTAVFAIFFRSTLQDSKMLICYDSLNCHLHMCT